MFKQVSLALLGLSLAACVMSFEDWVGEENYVSIKRSGDRGSETAYDVNIDLKVGTVMVEAGPDDKAYDLDLTYNELAFSPHIDFRSGGDVARFDFELKGRGRAMSNAGRNRLDLRLNPNFPIELSSSTGVSEGELDLTGMSVRSLYVETGVGETRISMLEPNKTRCEEIELTNGVGSMEVMGLGNFRFGRLKFRGGVGGASLEFSGDWTEIGTVEIEVGVGGVEIQMPRDIGAEVRVSKSFLAGVDLPGFEKRGDTYYSENRNRVDKVVRFRIRAGIGGVEFDWL